jgi:hypothetical protein
VAHRFHTDSDKKPPKDPKNRPKKRPETTTQRKSNPEKSAPRETAHKEEIYEKLIVEPGAGMANHTPIRRKSATRGHPKERSSIPSAKRVIHKRLYNYEKKDHKKCITINYLHTI